MENTKIAGILEEIADLLDLREANEFRIRAYRNAARAVRSQPERLEDLVEAGEDISRIGDIGESTAEKIKEILESGTCQRLEELRRKVPATLPEVMRVPGVGPRKAMQLHDELDIDSIRDLEKAARKHEIRGLPGMGKKTEEKIRKGIETVAASRGRTDLKSALEHVESLGRFLDGVDGLKEWEVAGSLRRRRETVGDLDILVAAEDRDRALDGMLHYGEIERVQSRGKERSTVVLEGGLQVDFRFVEPASFGAALLYFTGSKAHNIKLRKRAQSRGWKLSEYGLFKGKRRLAGKDEESVYHRLGLEWIPPELREDRGEIEASEEESLPVLIELEDIRGDLHSHTDATDGAASIQEMAETAREKGYSYLAITDHSQAVTVANGLDATRLKKHTARIRRIDASLNRFWLLAGIEVDILKSGELDLPEDVLADLDWVVASIHSHFELGEKKMTERLLSAISSGVVDCLGHPLGRLVARRDPIAVDFEKVLEACLEHDVALEINAQPERLDLPGTHVQRAREAGVRLTISTDAHKPQELGAMDFGVGEARRGWAEAGNVLNAMSLTELRRFLDAR